MTPYDPDMDSYCPYCNAKKELYSLVVHLTPRYGCQYGKFTSKECSKKFLEDNIHRFNTEDSYLFFNGIYMNLGTKHATKRLKCMQNYSSHKGKVKMHQIVVKNLIRLYYKDDFGLDFDDMEIMEIYNALDND